MKEIVFVLNIEDWQEFIKIHSDYTECATYGDTEFAIEKNINKIMTTSIAHCTKNLMDEYKFSLFYKGKLIKITYNTIKKYINKIIHIY